MTSPERLEQIRQLIDGTAYRGAELHPLPGDASFRRYIRIRKGNDVAMLMDAPPEKENVRPFVAAAEYLGKHGYSAPSILARDVGAGLLLLEDLGDDSFTSVLKKNSGAEEELYAHAIDVLAAWHDGARGFSNPAAWPLSVYNETLLMQEVALFSEWFLPQVAQRKAAEVGEQYKMLWRTILTAVPLATHQWVHRDYHADNLMWLPERAGLRRVGLLDFQDGVYGDAAYDLVSLLEDARRDVPPELAEKMLARYIAESGATPKDFMTAYAVLGAQRNCKIIGIFTRLAVRDGKAHYLKFLPRVWKHLERDLEHPALAALKVWMDRNVPPECRGIIDIKGKPL